MALKQIKYGKNNKPIWYVDFRNAQGQRVRRSTGTTDRKEAEALEAKLKLEVHQQLHWGKQPERSFDELMLDYLNATGSSKKSAWTDRYSAKSLYRFFSGCALYEITGTNIKQYINNSEKTGRSPHTIRRELALLSTAINYAQKEWGWEIPNPVAGRNLPEPEGRIRSITHSEANWLINAAEGEGKAPHLADFIRLALNTGCRRGELLGLEWSRVDLDAGLIVLNAQHTKNGKRRYIPLNSEAKKAISSRKLFVEQNCPRSQWVFAHLDGRQIRSIKTSFKTACRKSGIDNFRIHDLRHTCASWLVNAGVPLPEVRDLLGHSSIQMTEKYAHLSQDNVRNAVSRLDEITQDGQGLGKVLSIHKKSG
jgi:integrase